MLAATAFVAAGTDVQAQVPLSTYANANGYIDVQALTCAQLAGTFPRANGGEHELLLCRKAHPEIRIIQAIAVVVKDERMLKGVE
jgi:hypothetical protein